MKIAIAPVSTVTNSSVKDYATILLSQIHKGLKSDEVDQVLDFMEIYNLNPTLLNENLAGVQFNPNKEGVLTDIPTNIKAKLTRTYNKRHEATKIKGGAKGKDKVQADHAKFDPELECMEDNGVD